MKRFQCNCLVFIYQFVCLLAYKPVFLVHGIISSSYSMQTIAQRIQELHPGTTIYCTDKFSDWKSLDPMWGQVQAIGSEIMNFSSLHPEGINLLGYSQGGLVSRVALQAFRDHNVKRFISLSSPQAGQFGAAFLHLIFPNLASKTAYRLFYSGLGQRTSVGNYWNDPHEQSLYFSYSEFLPYVNNEVNSDDNDDLRIGLTKLDKMILIGGPDDGVITPWQSSQFGFFDENETVVEIFNREIFTKDRIGLKSLKDSGKLELITVPNMTHVAWHLNTDFIDKYVVPLLD